jgi:aspartyl protease family protein
MTNEDSSSLTYGLLCLTLVASALFARKLPLGQSLKMIVSWIGIFAGVYVLFLFRPEFMQIWQRVKADVSGGTISKGGQLIVRKAEDGHFYVDADVNGRSLRFLVDSGATVTTLSTEAANQAGVSVDEKDFPVIVETANGMATEHRAVANSFKVGSIERSELAIHVGEGIGETNVLGMNFLSTLASWRVAGEELILTP